MIADLDRTIEQLLTTEIPINNGEIDIKFEQPRREWSARLARPTINFFLYDVRENNILRQHQWQEVMGQDGRIRDGLAHRKRSPFRIDCHYLMTTWAADPQDEHRLLARCLLALFRHPILPRGQLAGEMQHQPFDIPARVAAHDRLANPAEIWGSLDNEVRPSISYVVTLALDPWTEVTGPVVRTFTLRTGQSDNLPRQRVLVDETAEESATIRGTVTRGSEPQAGLEVAVKGTGLYATTDEEGQFKMAGLPSGDYILIVRPATGKPKEMAISVPADGYDIEL